jgi:hypothetical protein
MLKANACTSSNRSRGTRASQGNGGTAVVVHHERLAGSYPTEVGLPAAGTLVASLVVGGSRGWRRW